MPSTWLDNINMLELSAVRRPANRKRRLLTKSEDDMPELWIPEKTIEELFQKSALSDAAKSAIKAALGALGKAKGEMPDDMFKGASAALSKLLGFGATAKAVEDEAAKVKKAEDEKGEMLEVVKDAITKLEGDSPAINEAIVALAKLADVTPQIKRLDALPPELKSDWEALVKSREADRKELEELKKSLAEREAKEAERVFVTKAETELKGVPMDPKDLGALMHLVSKNEELAASLDKMLKSVNELTEKSEMFKDMGGRGEGPSDPSGIVGKIEAMAKQLVEKSEVALTPEQAFTLVLERNPKLYDQYIKSQTAA